MDFDASQAKAAGIQAQSEPKIKSQHFLTLPRIGGELWQLDLLEGNRSNLGQVFLIDWARFYGPYHSKPSLIFQCLPRIVDRCCNKTSTAGFRLTENLPFQMKMRWVNGVSKPVRRLFMAKKPIRQKWLLVIFIELPTRAPLSYFLTRECWFKPVITPGSVGKVNSFSSIWVRWCSIKWPVLS